MSKKIGKGTAAIALGFLILTAAAVLAVLLLEHADKSWQPYALLALGVVVMIWLMLEVRTIVQCVRASRSTGTYQSKDAASMLVLMNEDGTGVRFWDLRDKTGLVIGRSLGGEDVDVDLADTEYFSFISNLHAALNFTENGWMLTDAGSKNGTALLRKDSQQKLLLAPGEPVPVRQGDTICIAEETKLALK